MIDDLDELIPDEDEVDSCADADSKSVKSILEKYSDKEIPKHPQYNDIEYPWIWNGVQITEMPNKNPKEVYSFVYKITNNITGKFYIGYKGFYSNTTKIVKHKRKHIEKESDWQKYWSSGELLHKDITYYGCGNFTRKIIALCPNKAIGKFIELCYQIKYKVCTENADNTFNNIINVRLSGNALRRYKEVIYADDEERI